MKELIQAIGFLTRIPVGRNFIHDPEAAGAAVSWYGAVGAILGLILILFSVLLAEWIGMAAAVSAALIIILWTGITGALHLDGLADCGDAWMGGFNKERMLEIMKDRTCGTGAIFFVVCVLALKLISLTLLFGQAQYLSLLFATILSRLVLGAVIVKFPYVRKSGLGSTLGHSLNPPQMAVFSGGLLLILAILSFEALILSLLGCGCAFALIYFIFVRKVGGFTGDIYGALTELTECFVLVVLTYNFYKIARSLCSYTRLLKLPSGLASKQLTIYERASSCILIHQD